MVIPIISNKRALDDVIQDLRLHKIPLTIGTLQEIRSAIKKKGLDTLLMDTIKREFSNQWQELKKNTSFISPKQKRGKGSEHQRGLIQKEHKKPRGVVRRTDQRTFTQISTKEEVDAAIDGFMWPKPLYHRERDLYLQRIIGKNQELMDYYHQRMKAYFGISHVLKEEIERLKQRGNRQKAKTPRVIHQAIILKPRVVEVDYVPEEEAQKVSSFEILQKKEWILDWDCVKFRQGYFVVLPPSDGRVKFKPKAVSYPGVIESYNYLKEYLNERLEPVHCYVEEMELTIYDTIRLNEAIQKFAKASRQRAISVSGVNTKKGPAPQQRSFEKALSKAKQMTPEEFQKYKSEYINYLVTLQSEKYKVIPCVERMAHTSSDITEYAFMFSLECRSGNVLIVHENVNPDRSTLLFVVEKNEYNKSIRSIYDFLQSAIINKRSSIREGSIRCRKGIINYLSINHDDMSSWKNVIEFYVDISHQISRKKENLIKTKYSTLSRLLHESQTRDNFPKVRHFFEEYNLPLTRSVKPAQILALIPDSCFRIDKEGHKRLPIQDGAWSLEKLGELINRK